MKQTLFFSPIYPLKEGRPSTNSIKNNISVYLFMFPLSYYRYFVSDYDYASSGSSSSDSRTRLGKSSSSSMVSNSSSVSCMMILSFSHLFGWAKESGGFSKSTCQLRARKLYFRNNKFSMLVGKRRTL